MVNGKQPGSGGRTGWPVRLATAAGASAGAAVALLWRPDLGGFWPGLLGFGIVTGVGAVLGRLAGSLLFRRPPEPEQPEAEKGE